MQKLSENFLHACREICERLSEIENLEKNQIKNEIKETCSKYSLERLPRNSEILSAATEEQFPILQKVLLKKPVKSASGVTVIAIMPKPFAALMEDVLFVQEEQRSIHQIAIQVKNLSHSVQLKKL
ncbi:MAG: hypothetical protein Ct9H300mP17_10950 [Candidatus Nitrosopelagicus sp.]|nr:MAG: hypothetical protein Ct9H300mP17_10950 [Candidatus Nitrosopelagicus sp.]